ncbi:hypothetical protein BKA93DRAFT_612538 [Sparassis latifolia]
MHLHPHRSPTACAASTHDGTILSVQRSASRVDDTPIQCNIARSPFDASARRCVSVVFERTAAHLSSLDRCPTVYSSSVLRTRLCTPGQSFLGLRFAAGGQTISANALKRLRCGAIAFGPSRGRVPSVITWVYDCVAVIAWSFCSIFAGHLRVGSGLELDVCMCCSVLV